MASPRRNPGRGPRPGTLARDDGISSGTLEDDYELEEQLAPKVWCVKHRVSHAPYVVYKLKKHKDGAYAGDSGNDKKKMGSMGAMVDKLCYDLVRLDHPNVCQLVEAFDDSRFTHLVYNKVVGKPILEFFSLAECWSEEKVAILARQAVRALCFVTESHIYHGALEPKNLFLDSEDHLVITDFGLAGFLKPLYLTHGPGTSMLYAPPEIVKAWLKACKRSDGSDFSKVKLNPDIARLELSEKSDLWSLGVILFTILGGRHPFKGSISDGELANQICSVELNFGIAMEGEMSTEATDFLSKSLLKDPLKRPTYATLMHHPWLHMEKRCKRQRMSSANLEVCKQLGSLSRESQFKRSMMRFMVAHVPPHSIRALEAAFDAMDADRSGTVSLVEFTKGLHKIPEFAIAKQEDINSFFAEIDVDGGGEIGVREFVAATLDSQKEVMEQILWETFQLLDVDNSGTVSAEELATAVRGGECHRLGQELVGDILARLESEIKEPLDFESFHILLFEEGGGFKASETPWYLAPCRGCKQAKMKSKPKDVVKA